MSVTEKNEVQKRHLCCAMAVSALPSRLTTVSSRPFSFLIWSYTTWNPYRYTEPGGTDGGLVLELASCDPGALIGSASTNFLRIAVAGRHTLINELEDVRIWTILEIKCSSRFVQPYSRSIKFCMALRAYYATSAARKSRGINR